MARAPGMGHPPILGCATCFLYMKVLKYTYTTATTVWYRNFCWGWSFSVRWSALYCMYRPNTCYHNQGQTLVSPYIGMARKQDGGSNGCMYRPNTCYHNNYCLQKHCIKIMLWQSNHDQYELLLLPILFFKCKLRHAGTPQALEEWYS